MKVFLRTFLFLNLVLSIYGCQTVSPNNQKALPAYEPGKDRKEIIKEEKRRQYEADVAFRGLDTSARINKIAFGSGADPDQPQPIWKTILGQKPDLFLFAGDSVYSASKDKFSSQVAINQQYKKLNRNTDYRDIREKIPFMATWNDQDYGQIDGGVENPIKEAARVEFLKYWTYARSAIPEDQKGIYHSKTFGTKKQQLQVIMLDTRWDRSALKLNQADPYNAESPLPDTFPAPYINDEDKAKRMLSDKQWAWLESELRKPAAFRIIVSPIQVIANEHQFEKWGNFPNERDHLFNLIRKTKSRDLLIISGDRHISSIAKEYIQGVTNLYDVTSSGLNNPIPRANKMKDTQYLNDAYGGMSYGLINIDWDKRKASVEIRSSQDDVIQSVNVTF